VSVLAVPQLAEPGNPSSDAARGGRASPQRISSGMCSSSQVREISRFLFFDSQCLDLNGSCIRTFTKSAMSTGGQGDPNPSANRVCASRLVDMMIGDERDSSSRHGAIDRKGHQATTVIYIYKHLRSQIRSINTTNCPKRAYHTVVLLSTFVCSGSLGSVITPEPRTGQHADSSPCQPAITTSLPTRT
jgi:hypothetical protein